MEVTAQNLIGKDKKIIKEIIIELVTIMET